MSKTFITDLHIEKVRHIENFDIPLSKSEMKHLIITGKNGSGKTSVLHALKATCKYILDRRYSNLVHSRQSLAEKFTSDQTVDLLKSSIEFTPCDLFIDFSIDNKSVEAASEAGKYIIVCFETKRASNFISPKSAEKISFDNTREIVPVAGKQFIQFMVNRFFEQLIAFKDRESEKVNQIESWFGKIQQAFRDILQDPEAKMQFDDKTYNFNLIQNGRGLYNLNQLPDGYSSVLNLVSELIMRMESQNKSAYDVEGVALIDEIETHLHVDLQKKILPFLTAFFPNIQFIVTTHSPFVISSIKNAVICDLEKRIVTEDLSGYSYGTLVESYFGNDNYSDQLKSELNEYESLMKAEKLTLDQEERLQDLEEKLNQLPKYWAPELDFKLKQIQLEKADRATA